MNQRHGKSLLGDESQENLLSLILGLTLNESEYLQYISPRKLWWIPESSKLSTHKYFYWFNELSKGGINP